MHCRWGVFIARHGPAIGHSGHTRRNRLQGEVQGETGQISRPDEEHLFAAGCKVLDSEARAGLVDAEAARIFVRQRADPKVDDLKKEAEQDGLARASAKEASLKR
ncbi:hypothetical protein [Bradyrhizobium sp.]|uniref:hypothetical protein n=1 Tax=Bradyrhizobium sp. TaxID=376 RepID=UPI003C7E2975